MTKTLISLIENAMELPNYNLLIGIADKEGVQGKKVKSNNDLEVINFLGFPFLCVFQ